MPLGLLWPRALQAEPLLHLWREEGLAELLGGLGRARALEWWWARALEWRWRARWWAEEALRWCLEGVGA